MITLYASKGSGSTIVEGTLELLGVAYERREVDYGIHNPAAAELAKVNPLGQVPTLVLEDGSIMTESAAIVLWLMEQHPDRAPAPPPGHPDRPRFLRWLVYFVSAIYPMYTVGDEPAKWVAEEAAPRLKDATVERTLLCWRILEENLQPRTHLLGETLTVLDVYAGVMSRWRPGRKRIREVAPRAMAAAERAEAHPALAPVFERNFGQVA